MVFSYITTKDEYYIDFYNKMDQKSYKEEEFYDSWVVVDKTYLNEYVYMFLIVFKGL